MNIISAWLHCKTALSPYHCIRSLSLKQHAKHTCVPLQKTDRVIPPLQWNLTGLFLQMCRLKLNKYLKTHFLCLGLIKISRCLETHLTCGETARWDTCFTHTVCQVGLEINKEGSQSHPGSTGRKGDGAASSYCSTWQ